MVYYHIDIFYTIWYVYYCVELMYIMSSMLVFACKKKNYLLCSIENFFMSFIGLCVKKNLKLTKTRIQYFLTHIYANFQYVVTQEM